MRSSFTAGERWLSAAGLVVTLPALMNLAIWQRSLLGLTAKQTAIIAFIPLFLIIYYITRRPDPERLT